MRRGFLNPPKDESTSTKGNPSVEKPTSDENIIELTTGPALAALGTHHDLRIKCARQILTYPIKYAIETEPLDPNAYKSEEHKSSMILTRIPSQDDPNGVSQCLLPGSIKENITLTPGYPRAPPTPIANAYHIASAGSKGQGMFASRDIDVGDLIVAERPLLVIAGLPSYRIWELTVPRKSRNTSNVATDTALTGAVVNFVVGSMDEASQKAFWGLSYSVSDPLFACGIMRSNSQLVDLGDEGYAAKYIMIMKDVSRVNHSCAPNTVSRFDTASFSFQLRAARPIAKDDEITTSYLDFHHPNELRKAVLKTYGIHSCLCTACSQIHTNHTGSEALRATIGERALKLRQMAADMRSAISTISSPSRPLQLKLANNSGEAYTIKRIFERAKALMEELERYGFEGCSYYGMAASVFGYGALAVMRHERVGEIDEGEFKVIRKRIEKIAKAHEGEDGKEYLSIVRENREVGIV